MDIGNDVSFKDKYTSKDYDPFYEVKYCIAKINEIIDYITREGIWRK